MRIALLSLGIVGGFGLAGSLVEGLVAHTATSPLSETLNAHEQHASASLFGQFRSSVTAWLWLRTDLYLHNGVEMRKRRGHEIRGEVNADNAHGELHDDTAITTVIPGPDMDFRGWLGDMERATSTYQDMRRHEHNDPRKVLPLFRLMTWLDPMFVPGWIVGASVLARGGEIGVRHAAEYLREGLRRNPSSIALLSALGTLHAVKLKDLRSATLLFERAIRAADPSGRRLSDEDAEGLLWAFRYLTLIYRDDSRWDDRRRVVSMGLARFPDDGVLRRNRDGVERLHGAEGHDEPTRCTGAHPLATFEEPEAAGHQHGPGCGHDHDDRDLDSGRDSSLQRRPPTGG